jgi:hypothetical protein
MARKILPLGFWLLAAALLAYSVIVRGWALAIPGAVIFALIAIAIDVHRHREVIALDLEMIRTLAHVLSAVAVAATIMYWLGLMLLGR